MTAQPPNGLPFAIVVIGGSAGALTPLQRLVADFPPDLPAAVFVATHTPAESVSAMPHILSRAGALFATHALDGAPIAPRRIVIAPPNFHLVVARGYMRVVDWAKENGYRPAIDVLFRSAAESYGSAVCGVLLSGTLDDGVAGLRAIREANGTTLVQDPAEALFADMPRNAIDARVAEIVAPAELLGSNVRHCVEASIRNGAGGVAPFAAVDERREGKPSVFTCPDCHGTLWELEDEDHLSFRCRTGHAYSATAMLNEQREDVERSLYAAMRVLQERGQLLRRLARRAAMRGDEASATRFNKQADDLAVEENTIRHAISHVIAQRQSSAS